MDSHPTKKAHCEFCVELENDASSRFSMMYGDKLRSRVLFQDDAYVTMPTIGQLFAGSLLILPKRHVERFADLTAVEMRQGNAFLEKVLAWVSSNYVLFEHGARCVSGGGCGIYHAHLHIVPVPTHFSIEEMLPSCQTRHSSLLGAWSINRKKEEYIVACDTLGNVASIDQAVIRDKRFGSQHMRKLLVRHFSLDKPWDWRVHEGTEQDLLQTVADWSPSNVL